MWYIAGSGKHIRERERERITEMGTVRRSSVSYRTLVHLCGITFVLRFFISPVICLFVARYVGVLRACVYAMARLSRTETVALFGM